MIQNVVLVALAYLATTALAAPSISELSACPGGHQEGARWTDGSVINECKREGAFLSVNSIGCSTPSGPLDLGAKTNVGDLVYTCARDRSYTPTFRPWGCFGKDGQQHATGDEYNAGDLWYYCMDKNGVIASDVIGCVHNGQRYHDGERYIENDIIFSCFVRGNTAVFEVTGCVPKDIAGGAKTERKLGCSWIEGNEPFQIQFQCVPDAAKKTAAKTAEQCLYSVARGTLKIDIGCSRVVDKVGVVCMKNSNDPADVKLATWPVDENGVLQNPPAGIRSC